MPTLPERPNLDQLKRQASELQRDHGARSLPAVARILAQHPKLKDGTTDELLAMPLSTADAQLVIAREYGFASWPKLKHHVELRDRWAELKPHPRFAEALAFLDAGDLDSLRNLLQAEPSLLRAQGHLEPPFGYFTGATLLHHVAGNLYRGPLPSNIVEIARLLLDLGADPNAETLGENGGTTMDLIITSQHASEAGVSGALMDLLIAFGAKIDLGQIDLPLANHAPRAAEKMIELGAKVDLCAAAALGRMDLLSACFADSTPPDRDAIGLALLFAYVNQHAGAVDLLLEKDGNWNMIGVNNGTALHRAAGSGDLAMVQRLFAKGADLNDRNNPFKATPFSWADHEKRTAIVEWMRAHCPIDLHDAVCFDLPDHVEARLREDPSCGNRLLDQWELPRCTALHHAARLNRLPLAKLLLEKGANPNLLAGDGRTAPEIAESRGHHEMAQLLRDAQPR